MASRDKRIDLSLYDDRDDKLVELCGGDPSEQDPDLDVNKTDKLRELIDVAHAGEEHVEIFEMALDVSDSKGRKTRDKYDRDFKLTPEMIREKYGSDEYLIDPRQIFKNKSEASEQ